MSKGKELRQNTEDPGKKEAMAKCQQDLALMHENPQGFSDFVAHWKEFLGEKEDLSSSKPLIDQDKGTSAVFYDTGTATGSVVQITQTETQKRIELNGPCNNQFIKREYIPEAKTPNIEFLNTSQAASFLEGVFLIKPEQN